MIDCVYYTYFSLADSIYDGCKKFSQSLSLSLSLFLNTSMLITVKNIYTCIPKILGVFVLIFVSLLGNTTLQLFPYTVLYGCGTDFG